MTLLKGWWVGLFGIGLLPLACSDDDKATPVEAQGDAGAAAVAESFPPALGPEDCVSTVTGLKLSQPPSADVWGGLTLLEFEVEGAKARSFDVQAFDPQTEAWQLGYTGYTGVNFSGQRDDGTYLLGVSVVPSAGSEDGEQRLRVRPTQAGCPEAEWTESDTFTLGNPFEGTAWLGSIPAGHFSGQLSAQDNGGASVEVRVGDMSAQASFGEDGSFSETLTIPLESEKGAAYDACTFVLTFEGSWSYELQSAGDTPQLRISELNFTSNKGSKCAFPALADLDMSGPDYEFSLPNSNYYYPRINYVPTLAAKPGAPVWSADIFDYLAQTFPELLSYVVADNDGQGGAAEKMGSLSGGLNLQQTVTLEKQ